jgi:hypothetical protein
MHKIKVTPTEKLEKIIKHIDYYKNNYSYEHLMYCGEFHNLYIQADNLVRLIKH